jgi:hypothetical protein
MDHFLGLIRIRSFPATTLGAALVFLDDSFLFLLLRFVVFELRFIEQQGLPYICIADLFT